MLTVSTFFWNDPARRRNYSFTHDHVRILKSMVERNLTVPHRFLCVTDDTIDGIETLSIDWGKHVPGTCFVRLCMRKPEFAAKMGERIFNLDLDMVVVGNLDPLVNRDEPSVFWRNPNWPQPKRAFFQTSVQLFDAGSLPQLWEDFDPHHTPSWVNWRFGGAEQAWASEKIKWTNPHWTHRDGIYGAGRIGDWKSDATVELPDNAILVSFPGNRIPDQPDVMKKHPWVREHYR